jgi:hypothetical protein
MADISARITGARLFFDSGAGAQHVPGRNASG